MEKTSYSDDDRRRIINAANVDKPSPQAMKEYRQLLLDDPDAWRTGGNLARQAQLHVIESIQGNELLKASLQTATVRLAHELGYKDANPLERLLIDQIVAAWLVHYEVHYKYTSFMAGRLSLELAAWWEKRLSTTQGRYLRAMEALARVRKLSQRTPLQINIAGQQINLAGAGEAVNLQPEEPRQITNDAPTIERIRKPARHRAKQD